nr:MAG TPA: hypothetical protein [Bacteriophage sp.]
MCFTFLTFSLKIKGSHFEKFTHNGKLQSSLSRQKCFNFVTYIYNITH